MITLPFHLRYSLSRRQRVRVELVPWIPAIAGTLGFGTGAAYLAMSVSAWFLLLLAVPLIMYRGMFAFFVRLLFQRGQPVEVSVRGGDLELRTRGEVKRLALDGIFQVFRSGDLWTVLHLDGTVITIPANAISAEQIEYLRVFAHRRLTAARTH